MRRRNEASANGFGRTPITPVDRPCGNGVLPRIGGGQIQDIGCSAVDCRIAAHGNCRGSIGDRKSCGDDG